jgi:signal transduction histidine kinase
VEPLSHAQNPSARILHENPETLGNDAATAANLHRYLRRACDSDGFSTGRPPAPISKFLDNMIADARRLTALLDRLRELARADNPQLGVRLDRQAAKCAARRGDDWRLP